jgi:predicted nucleic acid-binding protein
MVNERRVCCDTSFLFSIYGNDIHTEKALAFRDHQAAVVFLSPLNGYELLNALRLAGFRRLLSAEEVRTRITRFEKDVAGGQWGDLPCNLADVLRESARLSKERTLEGGHRSFDILHVAAARVMGAQDFLTFDANQRRLAESEGLKVPL